MTTSRREAIGFTVKSGWASVVLVAGSPTSPEILDSRRIELSDPLVPKSRQPYHEGFGTARKEGAELSTLVASVTRFGQQSVMELIQHFRSEGHELVGAGIVVGSLTPPDAIKNDHIRIHALEGQLFRQVIEEGLVRSQMRSSVWRERDLYGRAADILKVPEKNLRDILAKLGEAVKKPWRLEQKAAALAAWLTLAEAKAQGR